MADAVQCMGSRLRIVGCATCGHVCGMSAEISCLLAVGSSCVACCADCRSIHFTSTTVVIRRAIFLRQQSPPGEFTSPIPLCTLLPAPLPTSSSSTRPVRISSLSPPTPQGDIYVPGVGLLTRLPRLSQLSSRCPKNVAHTRLRLTNGPKLMSTRAKRTPISVPNTDMSMVHLGLLFLYRLGTPHVFCCIHKPCAAIFATCDMKAATMMARVERDLPQCLAANILPAKCGRFYRPSPRKQLQSNTVMYNWPQSRELCKFWAVADLVC
jgi:hypothetical protein